MTRLKHFVERAMRRIETLPIGLAGGIGLVGGLALGYGTLLKTDGTWGLVSFSAVLLIPVLLGMAARPVLIPEVVAEEPGDEDVPDTATVDTVDDITEPELRPEIVITREPTVATLLEMVPISGGSFMMGSEKNDKMAYEDEYPRHTVRLDGFELAKTPLTRGQYLAVIADENSPDEWSNDLNPELPATHLTWFDAIDFCNALSQREGLEPSYLHNGDKVEWISRTNGYRLPTEAEWEYACRAGSETSWFFGDDEKQLKDYGWYRENSGKTLHPVAQLKANPFDLYDMSGNVWEWCWDWHGKYEDSE